MRLPTASQGRDDAVKAVNYILNFPDQEQPAPLPKFLLRGGGGYVAFETLAPRGGDPLTWQTGDDALKMIRENFPPLSDPFFNSVYGIRNSSRERCIKHLQSGSFDLEHLAVTQDLQSNLEASWRLMVVKISCAPSQKLASGDMYSVRCAVKLGDTPEDNNQLLLAPESKCDCPAGVFFCAHRGALLLLLHVVQKCHEWDYRTLVRKMPEPIHKVLSCPIAVSYCFPRPNSEEAKTRRTVKNKVLEKLLSQLGLQEGIDDSEESDLYEVDDEERPLANPGSEFPVPDVAGSVTVEVIKITDLWIEEINAREAATGHAQRLNNSKLIEEHSKQLATPNTDPRYRKRQLLRLQRIRMRAKKNPELRSMLSLYATIQEDYIEEELLKLSDVDGTMPHPEEVFK